MDLKQIESGTAPCGLDCFNCTVFVTNITEDIKAAIASERGMTPEEVSCRGCRTEGGCRLFKGCKTLECVNTKQVRYCFECDGFPCGKLQPASEGADQYPHNFKLFNLCRMKAVGVKSWAEKESVSIREKYFKGTFIPGTGPMLKRAGME